MAIVDVGNMPGANLKAYMMLPIRILVFSLFFSIMYPMFLILGFLRALYLRIVIGPPSKILKYGTYPYPNTSGAGRPTHKAATHYPAQFLYDKPLDEAKLRAALLNLTAEDGIAADEVELTFKEEKPNDWPTSGSYDVTSALLPSFKKGYSYINKLFGPPFGEAAGYKEKIKIFVYNNDPGKPTVMHYGGSAEGWDGSSNYNFVKELMRRYAGLPPKAVFAKPEISAEGAAKFDEASFLLFLLKMPFNVFMNVRGAVWNMIRAATWAGGNEAFAPKIVAMNFTNEESEKLTKGCKKLGASPFAAFTFASQKAMREVVGTPFTTICNQASLQTRFYPVEGQGKERDFVGDWLVGLITKVPGDLTLEGAQADYKTMIQDLNDGGPLTKNAVMAKAYGVANSGAAGFEIMPPYNDGAHMMDRTLFMNNYGVRDMPPEVPFHTWNWNAPMWLGVNTISVNGKTTTLVGSCMWSLPIVEAIRDSIEITLRDIMKSA